MHDNQKIYSVQGGKNKTAEDSFASREKTGNTHERPSPTGATVHRLKRPADRTCSGSKGEGSVPRAQGGGNLVRKSRLISGALDL